jgi:uncharacterized membrane protein
LNERTSVTIIVILILNLVFMPKFMANADPGNLHGTIIDQDGNPIQGVKVSAYLNTGSIEATVNTDQKGYFRMNLGGDYTLLFEKDGYVSFQKNVQITQAPTENPDNDIVKLGNLVMEKTLVLSASVVKRFTTPGNTLSLEFTITNKGENIEAVEFSIDSPLNWGTSIFDNIGEIEHILLSPGSSKYNIEINVPETATSVETITITATGTSVAKLEFIITPKVYTDEIILKSTYLSISEEIGETINLPLTISNQGEVDKKVTLEADIPTDWSISFKTGQNMVVKSLIINAGDTEQLSVTLEPPDNVALGDYDIIVRALDVNGAILDVFELDVNLRISVSEIEVISSFTEVSIQAGNSVTFPIAVWNRGEADALTLFTVEVLPENWKVSFITDDLEIASIRIPAGESESVRMVVVPPNSVESGTYNLKAVIESDEGAQNELDFLITVTGSYSLDLEPSTLYSTSKIGGSVSYTARVTNRGQTAVTTLYLDAVLPDDWDATISPVQISSLDPRDSVTFSITLDIPSDATAGDYLITMQAFSDQLDSDEVDVRITAQASNTWGFIGLGLAGVSVVGAGLLFKRFKRR